MTFAISLHSSPELHAMALLCRQDPLPILILRSGLQRCLDWNFTTCRWCKYLFKYDEMKYISQPQFCKLCTVEMEKEYKEREHIPISLLPKWFEMAELQEYEQEAERWIDDMEAVSCEEVVILLIYSLSIYIYIYIL